MTSFTRFGPPVNIEKITRENEYYHKVFDTQPCRQITLRCLLPGEDIPFETHPMTHQDVKVEDGKVYIQKVNELNKAYAIKPGYMASIEKGTRHKLFVKKNAEKPAFFYIIYSGKVLHAPDEMEWRQHRTT